MATIAAPLLAAGALAVLGVVVQQPDALAWPGAALFLLASAIALLVTSVNASIWTLYHQRTHIGPATEAVDAPTDLTVDDYRAALAIWKAYTFWVNVARRTFMFGILSLWLGLGVAMIDDPFSPSRIPAVCVFALVAISELCLHRFAPQTTEEPAHWSLRV